MLNPLIQEENILLGSILDNITIDCRVNSLYIYGNIKSANDIEEIKKRITYNIQDIHIVDSVCILSNACLFFKELEKENSDLKIYVGNKKLYDLLYSLEVNNRIFLKRYNDII